MRPGYQYCILEISYTQAAVQVFQVKELKNSIEIRKLNILITHSYLEAGLQLNIHFKIP